MTTYVITTRDVDCRTRRTYKTMAGAAKRFEEMAGHTIEAAMVEAGFKPEAAKSAKFVRTVSNYGTVVVFERRE